MSNLTDIKILVMDVDGVLTDNAIIINADGSESKVFSSLDGHGIRMWHRAGLKTAFLSGRDSEPTARRARQLDIKYCIQDCHNKLHALKELAEKLGLQAEAIAFIGDDLTDLPSIRYAGFGVSVANAVDEVKQYADYVTTRPGGRGAVREVIEHILKSTGKWQELMVRYLPPS